EPVFHDAAARTVAFAGRVLPGLPEVETYSFAEAGRPALDLLLSCSRDVRADRASEAYEAVWRSKGLATRAVTERREPLQAAAARNRGRGLRRAPPVGPTRDPGRRVAVGPDLRCVRGAAGGRGAGLVGGLARPRRRRRDRPVRGGVGDRGPVGPRRPAAGREG